MNACVKSDSSESVTGFDCMSCLFKATLQLLLINYRDFYDNTAELQIKWIKRFTIVWRNIHCYTNREVQLKCVHRGGNVKLDDDKENGTKVDGNRNDTRFKGKNLSNSVMTTSHRAKDPLRLNQSSYTHSPRRPNHMPPRSRPPPISYLVTSLRHISSSVNTFLESDQNEQLLCSEEQLLEDWIHICSLTVTNHSELPVLWSSQN